MFIVSAEARSPAAAPPMPSATAISRLLAYPESWLLVRRRPVSVRATYRRLREVIDHFRSSTMVLPSRTWMPMPTGTGLVMRWLPR